MILATTRLSGKFCGIVKVYAIDSRYPVLGDEAVLRFAALGSYVGGAPHSTRIFNK